MKDYSATVARFVELSKKPRATQEQTLSAILRGAAQSEFGRAHGFGELSSIDEFRRRVPIASYEDYRPWLERDLTALTGPILGVLQTSSSTGKPKLVPYTEAYRQAVRVAHDVYSSQLFHDFPFLPLEPERRPRGLGLYQISAGEDVAGVRADSYASRLFDVALPEDPFFRGFSGDVYRIADARHRLYAMMLCAASWDVQTIRATNPTTLLLFSRLIGELTPALLEDLRAGRAESLPADLRPVLAPHLRPRPDLASRLGALGRPLVPRDLWPNLSLLLSWRGGTCPMFDPEIRERYGNVRIRAAITAASEGVMAIPMTDAMCGGVVALESTFFEFRDPEETGDRTITADEVKVGTRYELIMTSPNGMYRYATGDLFEIDGTFGASPTMTFLARKGRTSSITGEKLTELQVEEAVALVIARLGNAPAHFVLSAQFDAVPYYVLVLEWTQLPARDVAERFAATLDSVLQDVNIEYKAKRESHRLGQIVLLEARAGEFERRYAAGISERQAANYKMPHLSAQPVHDKFARHERT